MSRAAGIALMAASSATGCIDGPGNPGCDCFGVGEPCWLDASQICNACYCVVPCQDATDCVGSGMGPNCDPTPGLCQDLCPDVPCPEEFPNCGPAGMCLPICTVNPDCASPYYPNCGLGGLCFPPCEDATDCENPVYPNCDATGGFCFGPCADATDCVDPGMPNCDPSTGLCQGACPDTPCPPSLPNCTAVTGLCQGP